MESPTKTTPRRNFVARFFSRLFTWRIARRFQVEIEAIRDHNHLDGDFLHPGNVLRIPPSAKS